VEQGEPPAALARLLARGDRESNELIVREGRKRLRAQSGKGRIIVLAGLFAFVAAFAAGFVFKKRAEPIPAARVPVVTRVKATPAPRTPALRRGVALVFSPIDAEVFRDGKSLGGMPLTVPVAKGEVVNVEIRRDGFFTEKLPLDGSRPVVVVKLGPIPGVQPKVPVPAGGVLDALKRAQAAARTMLADAGTTFSHHDAGARHSHTAPTPPAPESSAAPGSAPPNREEAHPAAAAPSALENPAPAASGHP
jgi:hypothetical protein